MKNKEKIVDRKSNEEPPNNKISLMHLRVSAVAAMDDKQVGGEAKRREIAILIA